MELSLTPQKLCFIAQMVSAFWECNSCKESMIVVCILFDGWENEESNITITTRCF